MKGMDTLRLLIPNERLRKLHLAQIKTSNLIL
jgi:hypothetical protein